MELNWRWLSKCVPGVHSAASLPSGESEIRTEPWIFPTSALHTKLAQSCGFGDKDVGSWRILRCKQENMASSYYMEWGYHSPRAEACAQGACQCAASELWASPSPPHSLGHPPGESVSFSEAAVVEQALRPHRCVLTLCVVLGKSVNSCYSSCVMSENKTG